jgi:hypothetical protein
MGARSSLMSDEPVIVVVSVIKSVCHGIFHAKQERKPRNTQGKIYVLFP